MLAVDIYGTLVQIDDAKIADGVENWGTTVPSEQYWRRKGLPDFFKEVQFDREGNIILTAEQEEYAIAEIKKCKEGLWFFNNGVPTYITGKHYFYLTYWKLENDIYPDYRDTDRRYFLFLNHWENTPWTLFIFRGKKRREGASSQACSNLMYECIFFKNSFCGLVSKTNQDSRDTFTDMVSFGYRQLPVWLQPKQLNEKDSVTELVFAYKSTQTKGARGSVIDTDAGHRSRINYRAPVENAYDRGRISRGLWDEGGKWPKDVPFSKFISKVAKTMVMGAKKVGFAECPSTVNEMTKAGGAEFKICWDYANQIKSKGKPTPNRGVRYFSPAYDGYEGFIDKYGMSVIDEPTPEQYQYLVDKWVGKSALTEEDIKKGAKAYLLSLREGLEGDALEEEIRQNPFDEEEMFMYAGFGCEFNSINLSMQIKELEENPPFLRHMKLEMVVKETQSPIPGAKKRIYKKVSAKDDEKGGWYILEFPEVLNNFEDRGGYIFPRNKHLYQIGVDTTKDAFAVNGSKPTICVMKKSRVVNGEETGMYPVAFYIDKTRLDVHFDEEVLKACMLYGCTANYEIDARGDFYAYFCKNKGRKLLEWTPRYARNPLKENFKPKPGTQSGDPFQLAAQLQVCKMYIDGTDPDVYNGHVHRIKYPTLLKQLLKYDHSERTPFDQVIALMMALLPMMGEIAEPEKPVKEKITIWPKYSVPRGEVYA